MPIIVDKVAEMVHIVANRWLVVAIFESLATALCLTRIAFGSLTLSTNPAFWLSGSVIFFIVTTIISIWSASSIMANNANKDSTNQALLCWSSLPFLVAFAVELVLLQLQPEIGGWIWDYLSTIQPFPTIAMGVVLLIVFLVKALILLAVKHQKIERPRLATRCADLALPAVLILIGFLQSSVYLIPIGNAFLRFWAIADALLLRVGYPVTLTEPGPMAAGSPPYVYDLPLFPMILSGAFLLFGHNSAAGHLPAAFFNTLFPLSAYLLAREVTKSRLIGLIGSAITSLFPFFRFWVLNLPDPDPMLLTSLCFAGYFYLKTLSKTQHSIQWAVTGIALGVLSLARPEGILYSGFLSLGLLASRPKTKQFALFLLCLNVFLVPMIVVWMINFGFLWPQNYNNTLRIYYPIENYQILNSMGALGFYHRGLGLSAEVGLLVLALISISVLLGLCMMIAKERHLLAIAVPGIGNTVMIFFANPYIPNTFHFADFFRHASFGIPFLVITAAYGLHQTYKHVSHRPWGKWAGYIGLFLLIIVIIREGDILANPTATHYPGATQVLTTYTYLSMEDILNHPFQLPQMSYYRKDSVIVAQCTSMAWPEDALDFYRPLDMSFNSQGRPFGYASVVLVLIGICFALLAEKWPADAQVGSQGLANQLMRD